MELDIIIEKPVAKSVNDAAMEDGTKTVQLSELPSLSEMVESGAVTFILPIRRRDYFFKSINSWIYKILVMIYEVSQSGIKGDKGEIPEHQWLNTKLAFEKTDGTMGEFVELKGDKGDPGNSALTTGTDGVKITLPVIALGATYYFDVPITGARPNMCAVINPPSALLSNLTFWNAVIVENDKVRVYLKAGIAISAGQKTFHLRVVQ